MPQTGCCVVGVGPAGAMLALLLARQAVPVTLLEAHGGFDRDFRGDSLHPAIMPVMDELGLADQLLELPHRKLRHATLPANPPVTVDFGHLPYIILMPQARFLEFLTEHAARYPSFELVMRANVRELVEQDGIVRDVRYRAPDGWHELHAALTVGADGRFSQIRRLSGLQPVVTAATIDVLWFRLPRLPGDPEGASGGLMDCADARREQARALAVPGMVGAISSALNLTPVPSDRGGQPSSAASSCSLLSLPTKSISTRSLPSRSLCDQ